MESGLGHGIAAITFGPVDFVAHDITEHPPHRRADQGGFLVPTDGLPDQGPTTGAKQQTIDTSVGCPTFPNHQGYDNRHRRHAQSPRVLNHDRILLGF